MKISEFNFVDPEEIEGYLRMACPERADDLSKFWKIFNPKFFVKSDSFDIEISARANKITWMRKTFLHDWVVTYAGFKSLAAYAPHVILGQGEIGSHFLDEDVKLGEAEAELDGLLYFAMNIRKVDNIDQLEWPNELPAPMLASEPFADINDQACHDLVWLSVAATFLHELRHVQFSQEDNAPGNRRDEERICDEFSREMLLSRVTEYCNVTSEDYVQVISKRVIGLASTAFSIAEAEPNTIAAAIQDSHPQIKDRFTYLVMRAEAPVNANCWLYLACLLIAIIRRRQHLPTTIKFNSEKDLCDQLVELL